LSLCRAWMQAPEVDGLTVVKGVLAPGRRARVKIVAVNGVDFEAELVGWARPAGPEGQAVSAGPAAPIGADA
ncbi:MAG: hypothetical protein WCX13_05690, partial [Candidatus Hydrogenedentales bacterium]